MILNYAPFADSAMDIIKADYDISFEYDDLMETVNQGQDAESQNEENGK